MTRLFRNKRLIASKIIKTLKKWVKGCKKMLKIRYLTVNRETKRYKSSLYLYNQNLFINLNHSS